MSTRQTTGFVESLLRLIGLDWAVPDFSTLSRRQKTLKVNIPYRGSQGPLHLLVDNEALSAIGPRTMPNGIKVEGEGEWNARKHGGSKRRVWRKIHIGIDEQTLEIRAAEFTTSNIGDAPMLPELLDQIPPDQEIASGEPRERRRRLRHPQVPRRHRRTPRCRVRAFTRTDGIHALTPPRKNAKPWTPDSPGAVARNEILRTSRRLGRTIWRRW
jgi:hypothetical protein